MFAASTIVWDCAMGGIWGLDSPRHWAPGGAPTHAGELRPTQRELTARALRIAGRMAIGEAAVHPAQMAVQESLWLGSDGR